MDNHERIKWLRALCVGDTHSFLVCNFPLSARCGDTALWPVEAINKQMYASLRLCCYFCSAVVVVVAGSSEDRNICFCFTSHLDTILLFKLGADCPIPSALRGMGSILTFSPSLPFPFLLPPPPSLCVLLNLWMVPLSIWPNLGHELFRRPAWPSCLVGNRVDLI